MDTNANMKKYEDNKLMKMLRKLKGIISKSQGILDINLSDYKNIDTRLKESFHKYLNLLEKECKQIELDEKYFFDGILYDLDAEAFKIYLATSDENVLNYSEFFKENPYSKAYFNVEKGEMYINQNFVITDGRFDEAEALSIIAHVFEHYLYNRFKDKEEKKEEYMWLEEGINEIASKRILNDDTYEYNNYVTYIKSAFRYRMLSGKNFDENKIYAEHKLGRNSYLYNILTRDFCRNMETVLSAKREDTKNFSDKNFASIIENIYLKYILDINKFKMRNILKYDFSAEYKRYYSIAKNLNVHSKNLDSVIINRILDDVSTYCMKHSESEVEAIKSFLNLINEDIIYKSEFEVPEKKLMLITQILKIKSKYGDDIELDYEKLIEKYFLAFIYSKAASLEIEPLTGRFQVRILKERSKEKVHKLITIDNGDILYNKEYFLKKDKNTYEISTFLYDGTIKKQTQDGNIKVKKINMQNDVERREYERLIKLTLTEYKTEKKQIEQKLKESIDEFNSYFRRYIQKYIPSNDYKIDEINNVLDKSQYKIKEEEQVNTVILKYFSKTSEQEFLEDEEVNVRNLVNTFMKSDKVFRES